MATRVIAEAVLRNGGPWQLSHPIWVLLYWSSLGWAGDWTYIPRGRSAAVRETGSTSVDQGGYLLVLNGLVSSLYGHWMVAGFVCGANCHRVGLWSGFCYGLQMAAQCSGADIRRAVEAVRVGSANRVRCDGKSPSSTRKWTLARKVEGCRRRRRDSEVRASHPRLGRLTAADGTPAWGGRGEDEKKRDDLLGERGEECYLGDCYEIATTVDVA